VGEQCLDLRPLEVPAEELEVSCALQYPSIQLFIRRARLADSDYEPDPVSIGAIARVCKRLDGLPLAIELAASNLGAFSAQDMSDKITCMGEFLGTRPVSELAPHESFTAAVQWSLNLLSAPSLLLLKRLSTVSGTFEIDMVRAMRGSEASLAELCNHSLLQSTRDGSSKRYRVLEPIREVLQTCTTPEELSQAHLLLIDQVLNQTAKLRTALEGPEQAAALAKASHELHRYETVLAMLEGMGRYDDARTLVCDLRRFWLMSGSHELGLRWIENLLPHCVAERETAEALYTAGRLARKGENFSRARECFELGLSLSTTPQTRAGCLYGKALMLHILGRDEEAWPHAIESLSIFRKLCSSEGILVSAKCCGYIQMALGRVELAHQYHNEALLAARLAGDSWGELNALQAIGSLLKGEEAEKVMSRRICLCTANGFKLGLAQALLESGTAMFKSGRPAEALTSLGRASDIFRTVGHTIGMIQALTARAEVQNCQGDEAGAIALLEQALDLSLERPESPNGWRAALQLGWLLTRTSPGQAAALADRVAREAPSLQGSRLMMHALEAHVLRACALGDLDSCERHLSDMHQEAARLNRPAEWNRVSNLAATRMQSPSTFASTA
jgi:tetratricopeptide (TPR) repeat protein